MSWVKSKFCEASPGQHCPACLAAWLCMQIVDFLVSLARDAMCMQNYAFRTVSGLIPSLPAGDVVFMSTYALHRSPDVWEDPLRFDPDRCAAFLHFDMFVLTWSLE